MAECSVESCGKKAKSRGWCASHLERWRRYGDPLFITPRQAETNRRIAASTLLCTKCGEDRPVGDFPTDSSRACGRKSYCKPCAREYAAAWIPLNRDRINSRTRERRAAWSAEQRAEANRANASWKKANPDRIREYTFRRRSLKAGTAVGEIDYDELWSECGGKCPDCGSEIDRDALHGSHGFASIDHIIPLSKGGGHIQENLRYCCLPCNLHKAARVPL